MTESTPERPFYPLATATLQTTVFDVVHMFSELGISAVPIVDDEGRVVNLYETVDVIVSLAWGMAAHTIDLGETGSLSVVGLHNRPGAQATCS